MDDDQELEFGRLAQALSLSTIEQLAVDLHGGQTSADGEPRVRHLYAVADLASRLSRGYFEDMGPCSQAYWSTVCQATGLLHESVCRGLAFEDLVTAADESVARAVVDGTPDFRLPAPLRLERYINQLGLASGPVQLVKLCDLRHEAGLRLRSLNGRPKPVIRESAAVWLAETRLIVPVLTKVPSLVTAPQLRRLEADTQRLDFALKRLESKRRTKE